MNDITRNNDEEFKNEIFKVNSIVFNDQKVWMCLQSENGPCPLIAILNVLLLRKEVILDGDKEYVNGGEMVSILADYIMTKAEETGGNLDVILSNFGQLQTGLIVDVCFSNVTDFKDDTNLHIFQFLNIKLYHGWLMDPEITPDYDRLINYSYDQLSEELVKESDDVLSFTTKAFLREFLQSNQLTYHGLCQLHQMMEDNELAVLFHNNHFSVIYKNNDVYLLCSDIGYYSEPGAVWQLLNSTSGDTDFVNDKFQPQISFNNVSIVDSDRALAEELALNYDFELAKEMQEEEDGRLVHDSGPSSASVASSRPSRDTTPSIDRKKESKCVIL